MACNILRQRRLLLVQLRAKRRSGTAPHGTPSRSIEEPIMGAFYGSIHVRTEDRAAVLAAVAQIARKQKTRFLVGPVLRGWVGVYPSTNGQDQGITRALARKLNYDL